MLRERPTSSIVPRALLLLTVLAFMAGCGQLRLRHPVPEALADRAQIPDMPGSIRTWGDAMSPEFLAGIAQSRAQTVAYYQAHPAEKRPATTDILALSGGGANGAYGAGFLYGWSETKTRPQFRLVTGISTGALIAPFAFVGTACDGKLKDGYTTTSTRDLLAAKDLLHIINSDSAADNSAMITLLTKWIDADMIRAVAAGHAKGRRLYIATVNLDAQRLVIWDMGLIASSGSPNAPELFRQVMRASASIPIVFPPLYLDVVADGKKYDEIHVDGGTISQVFLWDAGLSIAEGTRQIGVSGPLTPVRLFIIRNAILRPERMEVKPLLREVGLRAVDTLIKSQGVGDLFRLYATCQRDGFDFNVAHIPNDFLLRPKEAFDKNYMTALFEVGRQEARQGYHWIKTPFALGTPATAPATLSP